MIVGRIHTVDLKRWKVDIAGQKDAVLHLSAVNLPGGVQRMRTYEDQLSMRTLFAENDLVKLSSQVSSFVHNLNMWEGIGRNSEYHFRRSNIYSH